MRVYNFSSSSKGNATLIICGKTSILIDAGTTQKYLRDSLAKFNLTFDTVDLVLVTHFHSDHCKSLHCFSDDIIYSISKNHQSFVNNEDNIYEDIIIHPFMLSHDEECLGYKITYQGKTLTYITDTGYIKNEYVSLIDGSDYLILEFNHDIITLNESSRPPFLKKRILSDLGHLNNLDAALFLVKVCSNLKVLLVAHISDEANEINLIQQQIQQVFDDYNKEINFEINYTNYQLLSAIEA